MNWLAPGIIILCTISCCDGDRPVTKQIEEEVQIPVASSPASFPSLDFSLMRSLSDSAITYGDERAFRRVSNCFMGDAREREFLYYALTMANEHNSSAACYDVFYIIAYSSPKRFEQHLTEIDDRTRSLALYYLLRAYELGSDQAKTHVKILFGDTTSLPNAAQYWRDMAPAPANVP